MDNNERRNDWTVVAAIGLISLGVWFLLGNIFGTWWQDAIKQALRIAWPIALIVLGVLIYLGSSRGGGRVGRSGTRLYRSRRDRMIGGVLGGVGEYFGVDPTIVRIIYVILALVTGFGPGVLLYIVAMIVVPEEPAGAGVQPPSWPQPQPPAAPPTTGTGSWSPSGWPHSGTETVQTPPPPAAPGAAEPGTAEQPAPPSAAEPTES